MPLLADVSHRTWQRVGKLLAVAVMVALVALICYMLIQRNLNDRDTDESDDPTITATPSTTNSPTASNPTKAASATCTPKPTAVPALTAPAKVGPTLPEVAAFERASVLIDPVARNTALVPHVTCDFLESSRSEGDNGDDPTASPLQITVADIVLKQLVVDNGSAQVIADYTVVTSRNGVVQNRFSHEIHRTTWVWTTAGWRTQAETV